MELQDNGFAFCSTKNKEGTMHTTYFLRERCAFFLNLLYLIQEPRLSLPLRF